MELRTLQTSIKLTVAATLTLGVLAGCGSTGTGGNTTQGAGYTGPTQPRNNGGILIAPPPGQLAQPIPSPQPAPRE